MKYICGLCGFVYDEAEKGPIPEDYTCPLCGAGKNRFETDEDCSASVFRFVSQNEFYFL